MHQCYAAGVAYILTIGQYLRPSLAHLPVERFWHPDEFAELARIGAEIGFGHVESRPAGAKFVTGRFINHRESRGGMIERNHAGPALRLLHGGEASDLQSRKKTARG